jgi:hypothetical protein
MTTINTPQKGNETNVILALFLATIILLILGLSACKSPEKIMDKAYKTVSTDPAPATEKRKAQLSSWVAANFPIQEKVIEKEVIVKQIDTTQYQFFRAYIVQLNQRLSENNCPTLNADSIFNLAKETIKPEIIEKQTVREITTKDTTGNWLREQKQLELIATIGKINAEKQALQSKLEHSETKSKSKDKYLWWFIISVVVFVLSHYLRSKFKIPFIGK